MLRARPSSDCQAKHLPAYRVSVVGTPDHPYVEITGNDRAGLLQLLTTCFISHGYSIATARAQSRRSGIKDVFQLEHAADGAGNGMQPMTLPRLKAVLEEALSQPCDDDDTCSTHSGLSSSLSSSTGGRSPLLAPIPELSSPPHPHPRVSTRVCRHTHAHGGGQEGELFIRGPAEMGMLAWVMRTVRTHGFVVNSAKIETLKDGTVQDTFRLAKGPMLMLSDASLEECLDDLSASMEDREYKDGSAHGWLEPQEGEELVFSPCKQPPPESFLARDRAQSLQLASTTDLAGTPKRTSQSPSVPSSPRPSPLRSVRSAVLLLPSLSRSPSDASSSGDSDVSSPASEGSPKRMWKTVEDITTAIGHRFAKRKTTL
ncbi:unnamed protein product [Vitrella brassicaformis CCMP3155]|uniref:ACT domain-containing protein n=1 Tax=Vitrella brassicaformis (strain CCMP3155) TaxID=1169540 RepID=A0A0G4FII1_VITBC|nr:unnamed protein product [Vitrella brassicaformis CCMP3155]|eukprot:CEM13381.1 unnamed protein product [Vitrella brassicaformis CCMP3155]